MSPLSKRGHVRAVKSSRFHVARDHDGRGDPGNDGDRNFSFRANQFDRGPVLITNRGSGRAI